MTDGERPANNVIGIDLGGEGGIAVVGDAPGAAGRCRLLATFRMRGRGKRKTTPHAYQEKLREFVRCYGDAYSGTSQSGLHPVTDMTAHPLEVDMNIAVDGGAAAPVVFNWAGCNTGPLIAAQIQAAIQALGGAFAAVTVTYEHAPIVDHYLITSGTTGYGSAVVVTSGGANSCTDELKLGVADGGTETPGKWMMEMAAEEPGIWGYRSTVAGQRGWWDLASAVASEFGIPLRGYQPRTVKAKVGGGARASKHDMLRAARVLFSTLNTTHDGVVDACCIGWLLWNDRRVEAIQGSQGILVDAPRHRRRRRR